MKIKILIFLFFLNYGGPIMAQQKNGFQLICHFKNLPNSSKVYLCTQEGDTVVKTISSGDRFVFNGQLRLNGRFHFIKMDTVLSKKSTKAIFIENQIIHIEGAVGEADVLVKGSAAHQQYRQFIEDISKINDKQRQLDFRKSWFASHRESLVAPWFMTLLDRDEMREAYAELSSEVKAGYYGAKVKYLLDHLEAKASPSSDTRLKEGN
ncbi:DUF4369 domain-containing protein [Pedobacter sp. KBW06]|uniref:DUF4369 domain-containing protein n=1 Tax=Pedobacter sp. KBW06 TaxID=2153359 RepID=UPI0013154C2C|nr:DUF4369 domain-containing protein [Pedobacter sp. KBW06]